MLLLNHAGLSDIGLARQNNEDVWVALPQHHFFALADGMGGRQAGEVAAREAIHALCAAIEHSSETSATALRDAIEKANSVVHQMSHQSSAYNGMGTTLCCIQWTDNFVLYAHVGDSRIYRYRAPTLQQLTTDHSRLSSWLSSKNPLSPKPQKNIITRAVGTTKRANPEIAAIDFRPGDIFLLCSDGLSDVLFPSDIQKIIEQTLDLSSLATNLILEAKKKGSCDNITVLIVQLDHAHAKNILRQQLDDGPRSPRPIGDPIGTIRSTGQPL